MNLQGKVAVITGGSRGLGEATAKKLASLGADVALIDVGDPADAQRACRDLTDTYGIRALSYVCDVSDFEAVKATVTAIKTDFGTVHILVNNAGITRDGLAAMMKESDFDRVIAVNLKGAFNMIRHCAGLFLRNKEGCVINIASVAGLMGNVGQCNYAASKAGLIGMTKTIAKELAPKGIRCNAVAPGFIATDMTASQADNPLLSAVPLGRMGRPEDVAEAVAYLVSADYVTGEVLRVDGGIAM
jgi:3-oxoacyl-[acyl-carrier protein] reductase